MPRQRNTRGENGTIEKGEGDGPWNDSPHTGEIQEETIAKHKMTNKVHGKGYENKPLTDDQKKGNTEKSRTRARIEHVLGFMEQSMDGLKLKSIGIVRATGILGSINPTYDLFRYEQVVGLSILPIKNR